MTPSLSGSTSIANLLADVYIMPPTLHPPSPVLFIFSIFQAPSMTLAETLLPLLPLFPTKKKNRSRPSLSGPFEESLNIRLKSLLPLPSKALPSIPLSLLARVADVLSLTLSDAELIMSEPGATESESDKETLGCYLDSSVKLLDAANAATAGIDHVLRRRLYLRLAFHHLSHGDAGKARSSLVKWDRPRADQPSDLVGESAPRDLPSDKLSTVGRAISAVDHLSYLVAGIIAAVLIEETIDLSGIRVSGDFPWAYAFNEVVATVSGRKGLDELEAVETAVRKLTAAVDDVNDEDRVDKVRTAAEVAERATEELTEKFGRLSASVERMFGAGLSSRNVALQSLQVWAQEA